MLRDQLELMPRELIQDPIIKGIPLSYDQGFIVVNGNVDPEALLNAATTAWSGRAGTTMQAR